MRVSKRRCFEDFSAEEDQFILDNRHWLTVAETAKELRCSKRLIVKRAKYLGVSFRKKGKHHYRAAIPEDDAKLIEALLRDGLDENTVAKKMEYSIGTIRLIKKRSGILRECSEEKMSELEKLKRENDALRSTLESIKKLDSVISEIHYIAEVEANKETYITLINGQKHYFLKDDWTPDIEVIATSLSQINRWNGHTNAQYSVAQHSLLVASLVPDEFAFEALMHDAAEAYVGDCPKPLKKLLPQYQAIEDRHHRVIAKHYGLPLHTSDVVKEADMKALLMENIYHRDGVDIGISLDGVSVDNWLLAPLPAKVVREMFLERFRQLRGNEAK